MEEINDERVLLEVPVLLRQTHRKCLSCRWCTNSYDQDHCEECIEEGRGFRRVPLEDEDSSWMDENPLTRRSQEVINAEQTRWNIYLLRVRRGENWNWPEERRIVELMRG